MKKTIAAFDFDGTITTHDTLLPFLYSLASFQHKILRSITLLPTFIGYGSGLLDNHDAKQKLLTTFLNSISWETLQSHANHFSEVKLPQWVRPEALKRIQWHQSQGHQCIIVSAGLEIYLTPWAKRLGFEHIVATRLEHNNHIITGKMMGKNCYGQEKVDRLLQITGPRENYTLYAYGDSRGDKELLAFADHAFYRHMPQ